MIYNLSKIYIVSFIVYTILGQKLHITKRQFVFVFWGFVLSLSIVAYNMNPPVTWDIVRHSAAMNSIRGSGIPFMDFLFNNYDSVGSMTYSGLYAFNILRYIVVNISENNYLISLIFTFIDYSILGYIVIDWSSSNNENYSINLFTLLLSFTFMPYVHVVSGLRNALCASIMGLAIYLYLYKKKHILLFIILAVIAATIHPAAIITVPFVFLAKLKFGALGFIAVFAISASARPIAQKLLYSKINFLANISQMYLKYTSDTQYRWSRTPLYGVLIIIAFFLLIYFLQYKRFNKAYSQPDKKIMYNFILIYMLYIFGNIGNYDMVLRPAYVFGTLAPILNSFFSDKEIWHENGMKAKNNDFISLAAKAGPFMFALYVCYFFHKDCSQFF